MVQKGDVRTGAAAAVAVVYGFWLCIHLWELSSARVHKNCVFSRQIPEVAIGNDAKISQNAQRSPFHPNGPAN